jgi:hypothetical protein
MKLTHIALLAILGAAVATPVLSQPAGGQGMGPGMGMGAGMGPGAGKAMRFNANKDNTSGWALMSTEERAAHRDKMQGAKTYDECKATQEEHHKAMEARAKEKGATLPAPRSNGCERMKARGFFK